MRGQETQALHSVDDAQSPQQSGQGGIIRLVFSIPVYDLPQQGNLLDTLGNQRVSFRQNFFERAAAFNSALVRDNAESAGVRTAVNHRDEARCQVSALNSRQF